MKKLLGFFFAGLAIFATTFNAFAITQEEINQLNLQAEQACKSSRAYAPDAITANSLFNNDSRSNFNFVWSLLKDETQYQLCAQLTPKKWAQLFAKNSPQFAEKLNAIFSSSKTNEEKGMDMDALIEAQMSPQYGYANNNKASIRVAPEMGMVRLGWTDDVQSRSCTAWMVTVKCSTDVAGFEQCSYGGYYKNQYDKIYPTYEIYRTVNGQDTRIGTITGQIMSDEKTIVDISFSSPDSLLKVIGKDLVKKYISRLREGDASIPEVTNTFYDAYADIYKNSTVSYKIVAKDPGTARYCTKEGKYYEFSYSVSYDMNADGIPDFVDKQWYKNKIAQVMAPILIPIISASIN